MADSLLLFDVFGEHTRKAAKNVLRQPMSSENVGKTVLEGPIKPNETKKPMKPGEDKKSFLSNAGKVLQTPVRRVISVNVETASPMIYTEDNDEGIFLEDMEFTGAQYDMYGTYDDFFITVKHNTPKTPPPKIGRCSMEYIMDLSDDDLPHDFSMDSMADEDLGLPSIY